MVCTKCHNPEKSIHCKGMCQACYRKDRRAKKKGAIVDVMADIDKENLLKLSEYEIIYLETVPPNIKVALMREKWERERGLITQDMQIKLQKELKFAHEILDEKGLLPLLIGKIQAEPS